MRGSRVVVCLWPGLAALWRTGSPAALGSATLFSLLLNTALVVNYIWFETMSGPPRLALWLVVAVYWLVSIVVSARWLARQDQPAKSADAEDLLAGAQGEYLRGNWIEAELRLLKLLGRKPRDLEARLLLATLYRHTGRLAEAAAELAHLERFEATVQWRWEIGRERKRLDELAARQPERTEPDKSSSLSIGEDGESGVAPPPVEVGGPTPGRLAVAA